MDQLDAQLFAALHRGNAGDLQHYQRECAGAHVLEIGAGYGRLACALASHCRRIDAVELEPALVAEARRRLRSERDAAKKIRWHIGDACQLTEGSFAADRAVLAYNTLYCFNARAKLHLLRAVRQCMKPGGVLLFDIWNANDIASWKAPKEREPLARFSADRRSWVAYEFFRFQRSRKRVVADYFCAPDRGEARSLSIVHHYLSGAELQLLLSKAQFEIDAVWTRFSDARPRRSLSRTAETHIVRARAV